MYIIRSFNPVDRDAILDFGTPHTSGSNEDRKLKVGVWIDMHSNFTTVENCIR